MAEKTTNLDRIIKSFQRELKKMGIRSERVVVFGSYANGTAREDSDIDLFVVSRDWEKYICASGWKYLASRLFVFSNLSRRRE